jgi:hypothetical protein
MPVVREVAQIVHADVEDARLARTAEQGHVQHGEELREDRDDVDAHQISVSASVGAA